VALSEQFHARHGSGFVVAGDGNGLHGLAGLIANDADEVESSGGIVATRSEGDEIHASLASNLGDDDNWLMCSRKTVSIIY
jgi:hypothetical protein